MNFWLSFRKKVYSIGMKISIKKDPKFEKVVFKGLETEKI